MQVSPNPRLDRLYQSEDESKKSEDSRTEFERDRDRVLHSSAIRRLAGVTQVVAPSEGHSFHNRLTHTLKVAQIGRRISERLQREYGEETILAHGGLDPDVVEAAALCHDLGHPPFGHVTESALDQRLRDTNREELMDGFEGNAQSFRIVTRLAMRRTRHPGLNLTRATLNATLKYPWARSATDDGQEKVKFGAYLSEMRDFTFARDGDPEGSRARSLEAEIMDWADDVAYSVHDLEDFYKAGLVPLAQLRQSRSLRDHFLEVTRERWAKKPGTAPVAEFDGYMSVFHELMTEFPWIGDPYSGSVAHRASLRDLTSFSIGTYIRSTGLNPDRSEPHLFIPDRVKMEVQLLKELTWHFVIHQPGLATVQHGQQAVVNDLFSIYECAIKKGEFEVFPKRFQDELNRDQADETSRLRIIADTIASMTDQEAVSMHGRLTGHRIGSLMDSIPL